MSEIYILVMVAMLINCTAIIAMSYFMYKSTVKIAAFKRAREPWQAVALLNHQYDDDENESAQPTDEDFATIPDEMDLANLRKQL